MKIVQLYTPKDFEKLDKVLLYDVWYRQALTDKQVAKLFGVSASDVAKKRKELGIGWMNSAIASLSGGSTFTSKKKLIEIQAPKDWDGEPIPFRPSNHRAAPKYNPSDFDFDTDTDDTDANEKISSNKSNKKTVDKHDNVPEDTVDAAETWKNFRDTEIEDKTTTQVDFDEPLVIDGIEYDVQLGKDSTKSGETDSLD